MRAVGEILRLREEQNVEASRKTEQALRECTKQCDIEELARDLAELKKIAVQRRKCAFDSSQPLDGILAYLTLEFGGNVHNKGIVDVAASSVYYNSTRYRPENAADPVCQYISNDEKDSWICYDFKDRRVVPTSYSVRSCGAGPAGPHLKSWVIEVSNDGSSWTEIDRRDNDKDLNDESATANFKISKVLKRSFRFFRLKQTGKNHAGNYVATLTSLEMFGTLIVQ